MYNTYEPYCTVLRNNIDLYTQENINLSMVLNPIQESLIMFNWLNDVALELQLLGYTVYFATDNNKLKDLTINGSRFITHLNDINISLSKQDSNPIVLCIDLLLAQNRVNNTQKLLEDLSYYHIPYYGFSNKIYIPQLIHTTS